MASTTLVATAPELVVEVHICDQRRSYTATFTGPRADQIAAAFIEARMSTHAFHLNLEDESLDLADFPLVTGVLYPECEHGLSLQLCAGPYHYPADRY